jgi:hypothetical protein
MFIGLNVRYTAYYDYKVTLSIGNREFSIPRYNVALVMLYDSVFVLLSQCFATFYR